MPQQVHFEIILVKGLLITSCSNVTTATSGPISIKYETFKAYFFAA